MLLVQNPQNHFTILCFKNQTVMLAIENRVLVLQTMAILVMVIVISYWLQIHKTGKM